MQACRFGAFALIASCLLALCVKISHCDTYDTYRNSGPVNSTEEYRTSMLCMDIKPQHSLAVDHLLGMWYANEIVMHTQDVPGVYRYDTCVIIELADVTAQRKRDYHGRTVVEYNQQQHQQLHTQYQAAPQTARSKYLQLVWIEGDNNIEYTFYYDDATPGLWTNLEEQRGSLVALNHYTQFSGTVQVLKAVGNHLVLTFCGNDLRSTIYSIVLSRQPQELSSEELVSIRKLLLRRGLDTESIRQVCTTSAGTNIAAARGAALLLGILALLATMTRVL